MELAANDKYWRGKPKSDKITYRFFSEASTRVAELQAGSVDIVVDVPANMVQQIKRSNIADVKSVSGPTIYSFNLKVTDAITSDIRVRKAINMAVNKDLIVKVILRGYGQVINSLQSSLSFGYDKNLKGYEYNTKKAKELLKEAGIKKGTPITIDYRSSSPLQKDVSSTVANFLREVGFNAKINPIESSVFLNDIVPNGKTNELFQFSWGGWTFDFDNTAYNLYHTEQKWSPYLSDAKMDALLAEERKTYDAKKREKILQAIAKLSRDNAYVLPLYSVDTIFGINKKVKNFTPMPDNRLFLFNTFVE